MAYTLKLNNEKESYKELLSESSDLELESIYRNNYLKPSNARSNAFKIEDLDSEEETLTEDQQISLDKFIFDAMNSLRTYKREVEDFPNVEKNNYRIEKENIEKGRFQTNGKILDVKPLENTSNKKEAAIEVIKVPKNKQKQEEITKPRVEIPKEYIRNFSELLLFITNDSYNLNSTTSTITKNNKRINKANEIFKKISFFFKELFSLRNIEIDDIKLYFDINYQINNENIFPIVRTDSFGLGLGLVVAICFQYIKNNLTENKIQEDKLWKSFFSLANQKQFESLKLKDSFTNDELTQCFDQRIESSSTAQENKEIIIKNKFLFNDTKNFIFAKNIKNKVTHENINFSNSDNSRSIKINIIETTITNKSGFTSDINYQVLPLPEGVYFIYIVDFPNGETVIYSRRGIKVKYENKDYYLAGVYNVEGPILSTLNLYDSFYIKENNTFGLFNEEERDRIFDSIVLIRKKEKTYANIVEAYNNLLTLIEDYKYEYELTENELYNLVSVNKKDTIDNSTNEIKENSYNKIVNSVIQKAREDIKENGLGITQVFNTTIEQANENIQKLLDMPKNNYWNSYESKRSNIIPIELSLEETDYLENYANEIEVLFPEGLPEKIYAFELPFNWCGHYMANIYSEYLKKEIRRYHLPSTYRMFKEYGIPQNKIQPYNDKNPPQDNWKKENIVNNKAYIVSADFVWMRRKSLLMTNKLNKDTSLTNQEKNDKLEALLNEFVDIFNTILKPGDIVSCLPDRKNKKKLYGSHFSLITGEAYFDYGFDGEVHFYVPVIEGNFMGSVVEGVRDIFDIIVRYRFKEEDFINYNSVEQPVEKNSNDEIYFRRK